jgi:hypothetical protein
MQNISTHLPDLLNKKAYESSRAPAASGGRLSLPRDKSVMYYHQPRQEVNKVLYQKKEDAEEDNRAKNNGADSNALPWKNPAQEDTE